MARRDAPMCAGLVKILLQARKISYEGDFGIAGDASPFHQGPRPLVADGRGCDEEDAEAWSEGEVDEEEEDEERPLAAGYLRLTGLTGAQIHGAGGWALRVVGQLGQRIRGGHDRCGCVVWRRIAR